MTVALLPRFVTTTELVAPQRRDEQAAEGDESEAVENVKIGDPKAFAGEDDEDAKDRKSVV